VSGILPRVRLALPDLSDDVRERLAPLADAKGLEPRALMTRPPPLTDDALREEARTTASLDRLASFLDDERTELVHEATLRLILLGEPGCAVLASALHVPRSATSLRAIVDSLPLWPEVPALGRALAIVDDEDARLELRFRVALACIERAPERLRDDAIALLRRPTTERFFESSDWDRLVDLGGDDRQETSFRLAVTLADSPHPRAHLRAVETLLAFPSAPAALDGLRRFLECGTERMASLRRRAATTLHETGDLTGFPLVVSQLVDETKSTSRLFLPAPPDLIQETTRGFLAAGPSSQKETALLHHLRALRSRDSEIAHELVLEHATTDKARIAAATALSRGMSRERKLRRLIDVFLWGQRMGQRLLGKRIRVKMTGSKKLGFTRTQESVVYVTPLPMMRGDRFGREVVEALILHEIGHHMYHAGREADEVWKTAENEGIRGLFNLVADEHLERNLRAIEADYGDKLKRLAAYAFQHTSREIAIDTLLGHLGQHAHRVLTTTHVGLGRDPEQVAVESGALLFGMEKQGLAFARFARALRMGLGNRHADPLVDKALALFEKRFRHSTMDELLVIARKLKEIFGWETSLVESFGPHESLEGAEDGNGGDPESVIWGEGISQEEVDRVIERFTEKRASDPTAGGGGKLAINVNDDTQFAKITRIEAKPHDPDKHAPYRRKVEHPASVLRGYLEELGLSFHTEKMRLAGRRLDRARLLSLVTRADPRVLTARKVVIERDLFLGIVIDCSGSMQSESNIEKAKLFATLVTEAAAPLSNVDARIFGFTDQMIFDCGDARRSGVAGLSAGGGNNDAAALYHVAQVAKNSRRRAKVLIMISDGLPTECSVAALKNLVSQLASREQMVLAQVAVQPLSEVCFPHYVVLKDADITITVRRFGTVVASLVRRALGA
ncbi:MAG: VWA domain-containing protein, partial [Myxococcales bacterium]|nr:VWA domain-containing protein [Myxococcales bacterium]